jgi:hypothetical protein
MNPVHPFNIPGHPHDPFGSPTSLAALLEQGGQGFVPTKGFHIYTELRTTQRIQTAEDDKKAARYVKVLTDYVNFGASAATIFGVTLLEAQGEVLHFFKEGELNRSNLIKAIQFVYLFTREAYSDLRDALGDEWGGLASSLDGGPTVILRHSNYSSSSAISLAPSANRPAKRLLYGGTKARHLDVYKDSAILLGLRPTSGEWHEMNLDRDTLPFDEEIADAGLGRRLNEAVRNYRREVRAAMGDRLPVAEARNFAGVMPMITTPVRLRACSVRCDLDGFSSIIQHAFDNGTITEVVKMFLEILRFGDHMLRTTPGAIQLPWAGDCATTIVPDAAGGNLASQPRWLEFSMRWQQEFNRGAGELSERTVSFLKRRLARWAVGGCHGDSGLTILAPVAAQGRTFLIGVGWPVCMSLDAQNLGKGDEIVTRKEDYSTLDGAAQSLFRKSPDHGDFWKTKELTPDKLKRAAVEVGKSAQPNPADYLARVATISVPAARPYFE